MMHCYIFVTGKLSSFESNDETKGELAAQNLQFTSSLGTRIALRLERAARAHVWLTCKIGKMQLDALENLS